MLLRKLSPMACLLLILFVLAVPVSADEIAEKGRALLEENRGAVITVRSVLNISYGGGEDERENEANGTLITPDGLTVLSLAALDPTIMMQRMRGDQDNIVSKITNLTLLFADDTELDGEVVLRDQDLDLAFVRPVTKPEEPLPYVDLENRAQPQMLDQLILLGQLGKVARREHMAFVERVEAIVARPITFYVLGEDRGRAVACSPAFTTDGVFVGIGVMRAIRTSASAGMGDNVLVVVIDAEEIERTAEQVPDWKAPEQ